MAKIDFKVKEPVFGDKVVNIADEGAESNAFTLENAATNAEIINRVINELSVAGGGTVVVPAGIFYTAPIMLKSNINLKIKKNAVLKFSKDKSQYPLIHTNYEGQECIRTISPISAVGCTNIAITGKGIIDGSGEEWRPVKRFKMTDIQWEKLTEGGAHILESKETEIYFPTESAYLGNIKNIQLKDDNALEKAQDYYDFYRPVMVDLKHCRKVLLSGVTFSNSPAWNIHPYFCSHVTVRGIQVKNPYYAQNGDGIDIESCENVVVEDSLFETGDDAICLKSGKNAEARVIDGPCRNVLVRNCTVNNGHGGFVIGSEMSRGVKNVVVTDCTFMGTDVGVRVKSALGRGGTVENIRIDNINMVNIKQEAVILTMSYVLNTLNRDETISGVSEDDVPHFRDITFNHISCLGADVAFKIEPIRELTGTITDIEVNDSYFRTNKANVVPGGVLTVNDTVFMNR